MTPTAVGAALAAAIAGVAGWAWVVYRRVDAGVGR